MALLEFEEVNIELDNVTTDLGEIEKRVVITPNGGEAETEFYLKYEEMIELSDELAKIQD